MQALFSDRRDAGRKLAVPLAPYAGSNTIVIGLPRGGVPVAVEVADALDAPLDICVVRKVGVPGHEELAMGAVAEGGFRSLERSVVRHESIPDEVLEQRMALKEAEVAERVSLFRGGRPAIDLRDKTVIVVDDGLATGSTARVALQSVRSRGAARVVLAIPVAAADALPSLAKDADAIICLFPLEEFYSVGLWYERFGQTSDNEVLRLLTRQS